jgi:ABC-2 type transport system permease protein
MSATSPGPAPAAATDDGIIVDRGYRHWEGHRLGAGAIRWAITVDAVRRALALGRRARAKVFPWGLLALATMLAVVLTGLHIVAGTVGLPPEMVAELPGHRDLFSWYGNIALLFVAVVGPSLLVPDRRHGTLSLYLSRPLTVADYLRGKALAYLLVVGAIHVVPQLVLWLGRAAVAPGLVDYLREASPILWQVPVAASAFLLVQGALLAIVTTLVSRTGIAAAVFLGAWVAVAPIAGELSRLDVPGIHLLALLNLPEHPTIVTNWVFGALQGQTTMRSAGFDPWVSAVAILALAALAALVVLRRYRRLT